MRIGIDLDGVCADWLAGATTMLNRRFGLSLEIHPDGPPAWDWLKNSIQPEQWRWLWDHGVREGLFRYLRPIPGTAQALYRLSRKHDLYFLTNRPDDAAVDTLYWLVREFPSVQARGVLLFRVRDNKAEQACDVYLDDKPENCQAIRDARPQALVVMRSRQYNLDVPWNPRAATWGEFEEIVKTHSIGLNLEG